VVIGSFASNDLDGYRRAPLERETFLATRYWNIANSLIPRPVHPASVAGHGALSILALGLISGIHQLEPPGPLFAGVSVLLLGVGYSGSASTLPSSPLLAPAGAAV